MFSNRNICISNLWIMQNDFRKTKAAEVQGRPFHSLSYRLSGEVLFEAGGRTTRSYAGDITFMPQGCSYRTETIVDGSMLLIHFNTTIPYENLHPAFFKAQDPEIKNLFMQLCRLYTADNTNHYPCMALLYTLLDRLTRSTEPIPKRMRTAKNRIDQQYCQPLSIAALAAQAEMSEVHFRNEFKRYFGCPPLAYLKNVRITHAKQLLQAGYHSITEVALDCGFESTSYFSYEFKRMTGMTPSEYIKTPL